MYFFVSWWQAPKELNKQTNKHTKSNYSQLLLVVGPAWSVVDSPSFTPLEKTEFPVPRKYQLQRASRLGVGLCDHFLFSVLGDVLFDLYGQACAATACEFISVSVLLRLKDTVC